MKNITRQNNKHKNIITLPKSDYDLVKKIKLLSEEDNPVLMVIKYK